MTAPDDSRRRGSASDLPPPAPHRVVRASAGSGKTHRLASRYLEILFRGARPETIVAATFTREAAGEILGRVLVRLALAARDGAEAAALGAEVGRAGLERADCRRALRLLCDALDRVVVSTLDSFFYRLTAALRWELGLPGVPAVAALDDPLASSLREEALEATLDSLAADDWDELLDLFERLHAGAARRSVSRALDGLLVELYEVYQEASARELWGRLEALPGPRPEELAAALDALEGFLRASAPGALRRALEGDLASVRRGEWERLVERGLAGKLAADAGATRYGAAAIPAAWREPLAVVVAHAGRILVDQQVERTGATWRLLDAFHGHYWALRRKRGPLLFADLAAGLVRWLRATAAPEPGAPVEVLDELYYRIDARVGHLLLDEFQDTSLAQWTVLRPIAEEIRAWGDGSRTFFCVGDPKQAIYGWRGGCADLFDQIEEDLALEASSAERLEVSFRSSQGVLDAVNLVFGGLGDVEALGEDEDTVERWSAAFGPHRAARAGTAGYVELVESPAADDHLDWAARRIGRLAGALPGAAVAVLVHTNEQAGAALDALRRAGVEASGEGVGAVADDPAVAAVIAALELADHPADNRAAFHVASSPLGALIGLSSHGRAEAAAASRRLRLELAERGAAALLADWRRRLRPGCGERTRLRLAQAADLAARFEREGGGRPGRLVDLLRQAQVEGPRLGGVRVMTVHRAKGLEFDAVVLPALDRPLLRGGAGPVYLLRRSPLAPVEAVHRPAPAHLRRLAPELEAGHRLERARRLRDDLSVLYVALTRARCSLHLWLEPASAEGGAVRGSQERRRVVSFGAILRDTLGRAAENVTEPNDDDGARFLYRRGELRAVAAAVAAACAAQARVGQAPLPLAAPAAATGSGALRAAVELGELAGSGLRAAAGLLDVAAAAPPPLEAVRWRAVEAVVAGETPAAPSDAEALTKARAWLAAAPGPPERRRRFVCALGATTVTGELARVWAAAGPGERRVVVAAETASSAELVRAIAARVLGVEPRCVGVLTVGAGSADFRPP